MNYKKRMISLALSMLMVFTTIFTVAPQEVQAADVEYSVYSDIGSSEEEVVIYKGMKDLYIGDFFSADKYENPYTSDEKHTHYQNLTDVKGVTYKSSKKSVATVNSKGLITTKKTGTTTITAKFKGQTAKLKLKVIEKKTFDKNLANSGWNVNPTAIEKAAKTFLKKTGNNPTIKSSNRYKLLNAIKNYPCADSYVQVDSYDSKTDTYKMDYYIFGPKARRAEEVWCKIAGYCMQRDPFDTRTLPNCFRISSISGKGKSNKITVTLAEKVTEDQIFGAQYAYSWSSTVKKATKHTFPIVVRNTSTDERYYAIASIKKGSNKMTITMKNAKLKKGKTYELLARTSTRYFPEYAGIETYQEWEDYLGNWLDGSVNMYKFKAK